MGRERARYGKIGDKDSAIEEHVPYTSFANAYTIKTRDGYFVSIFKIDGIAWETVDQINVDRLKNERHMSLLRNDDPQYAFYHHLLRRRDASYPESVFTGFAQDLDDAYRAKLSKQSLFKNDQYITIVRKPRVKEAGLSSLAGRIFSENSDRETEIDSLKMELKLHKEVLEGFLSDYKEYGIKLLSLRAAKGAIYSEALSFLNYLISWDWQKIAAPLAGINQSIGSSRVFFGIETFEIRGATKSRKKLGAVLSVKQYPPGTGAGMIDHLLRLPHEIVVSQSFANVERFKSENKMRRVIGQMSMTGDAAVSVRDELIDAADETASNRIFWGEHHLTIVVVANDESGLDAAVSDVATALGKVGILTVREDLNAPAAFWAQLPGNFGYIARKAEVTSKNYVGFASLHDVPHGSASNNHWGGCVARFETTANTPYAMNFHVGDLGNFTVIGPSGTGKTVVLNFLLAQSMRFNPRCIFLDKDRGAEIAIRALGGSYVRLGGGVPTGWNPLLLPESNSNREFLRSLLGKLIAVPGHPLTDLDIEVVARAVEKNFETAPENRRLDVLQELFTGFEKGGLGSASKRLRQWYGDGERAWLFNSGVSDRSERRIQGYDLTALLDDEYARGPALMYLFHRIDQMLDGDPTLIFIDEGWRALDDEWVKAKIRDWEKTIRKRNGVVGFGSQSASDVLESGISDAIIGNSPTKIFMPNYTADEEAYCGGFGLTTRELSIIKGLPEKSRCFLLKSANTSVVVKLDLSGLDKYVAVLSGREKTVRALDDIRDLVGDDPQEWLPLFFEKVGAG